MIFVETFDMGWQAGIAIRVPGRMNAVAIGLSERERLPLKRKIKAVLALKEWLRKPRRKRSRLDR